MVSSLNKRPHGLNKIAGAEIAIAGIHLIELQPLLLPIASYLALRSECVGAHEIGIRPGPPMSWKGRGVRTPAGRPSPCTRRPAVGLYAQKPRRRL